MFKGRLFSFAILLLTAFALFLGFSQLQNTSAVHAKADDTFSELENFSHALNLIRNNYVEDVADSVLVQGAIKGMLQELDPHSSYFTPEQYKSFMIDMKGEFGGLGMTVSTRNNAVTVVAPIEDTPAYRAGIKSGDIIYKIDNVSTEGMSTDEAVKLMRGKPKTSVTLTIIRKGETKPLEFTIIRDIIRMKSVKSQMLEGDIAYIRLTNFQENSSIEMRDALNALKKEGAKGTIVDLRDNPGGSLNEAVKVTSLFLPPNKVVVVTKNRSGSEQSLPTKSQSYRDDANPLVILVNEGSASASEIVAGAMQDYKRGIVIGTTTFGKASVQTIIDLKNGGAMKLTTARYYTPNGRSIQGVGIVPDMDVPQGQIVYNENNMVFKESDLAGHLAGENETTAGQSAPEINHGTDLQLQTAVQLIKGMTFLSKK